MKSWPRHHTAHVQGLRATSDFKSFSQMLKAHEISEVLELQKQWKQFEPSEVRSFFPLQIRRFSLTSRCRFSPGGFSLTPRCQTPDQIMCVCVCCMLTFDGSLKSYPFTMCCYHQLHNPWSLQTLCTSWVLYNANVCLSALPFCNATPKRFRQQSSAAWCLSLSRSPSKPNAQFNNAAAMMWWSGMRANNASLSLFNKASAAAKIRSFNGLSKDSFPRKHFNIHIWMLRWCLLLILYNFLFVFPGRCRRLLSFLGFTSGTHACQKVVANTNGVCVWYFSSPESCCKDQAVFVFNNCFLQQCILRASCAWPNCSRSGEAWLEYNWIWFVTAKLKTPLNYFRLLGTFITAKLRTALAPMVT